MQDNLTRPQSYGERFTAVASWLGLLCQALEASVVVFLRRRFGARYLGMQAAAVIPVVLVYSLFWSGHDISPLLAFLGCYLAACVCARISGWRGRVRGDLMHSHYSGTPIVTTWPVFRGRLSERTAKSTVEPFLIFLTGCAFMPVSEPLGVYLMVAAAGLLFSVQITMAYERKRLADARDAYIEQRSVAERFRDNNWQ